MTALPHKSDLSPSLFSPLASKLLLACFVNIFVSIDFLHEFYCLPGILVRYMKLKLGDKMHP